MSDSLYDQTRTGEILDAAVARHKLDVNKGEKLPLEIRAMAAASYVFQLQREADPSPILRERLHSLFMILDPDLFIKNTKIYEQICGNLAKDLRDILAGRIK